MSPVVHFEIPYKVGIRVKEFYRLVFGWTTETLGPEMGDYILATTATSDVKIGAPAGAINGGFYPVKHDWPDQYPSVVVGVADIQDAMRKVNLHGGKVLGEPMLIPGTGHYVSFHDSEGNRLSILEPIME